MSKLLGLFGLATLGSLRAATERADRAKARAARLKHRLVSARKEIERWKRKTEETAAKLTTATQAAERWKRKDARQLEELRVLTDRFGRLERAEQHVELSRGQLLAMETKLDIVEGAINVLDRRTRESAPAPDAEPEPAETADGLP